MLPNSSETIVSVHRHQILAIFECVILNFIDGSIDEGMSDVLRSLPSPVDENIPIKEVIQVILCVVHDLLELAAA